MVYDNTSLGEAAAQNQDEIMEIFIGIRADQIRGQEGRHYFAHLNGFILLLLF